MIYNGITSGAAANPNKTKETSTSPMRIYLLSFPLNLRLLVFREIRGILVTISSESITA
jgi:hypothetical protein